MKRIIKIAAINAGITAVYIGVIASLMFYASSIFGFVDQAPSVFIPIGMLLLFVFSAAFTGLTMLGRPIMWYLNGKKKDALLLLAYTLAIFSVIMLAVFVSLVLHAR